MNKDDAIKPCAHCGSTPIIDGKDQYLCIRCQECGARGANYSFEYTNDEADVQRAEAEAIAAWNRRATAHIEQGEAVAEVVNNERDDCGNYINAHVVTLGDFDLEHMAHGTKLYTHPAPVEAQPDADKQLADFADNLAASQVPLGEPFQKVLMENLWELYATDEPAPVEAQPVASRGPNPLEGGQLGRPLDEQLQRCRDAVEWSKAKPTPAPAAGSIGDDAEFMNHLDVYGQAINECESGGYYAETIARKNAARTALVELIDARSQPAAEPAVEARVLEGAATWIKHNYHDYANIDTLVRAMVEGCRTLAVAPQPPAAQGDADLSARDAGVRKAQELLPKLHSLFNRLRNPEAIKIKCEQDSRTVGDASDLCRTVINAATARRTAPAQQSVAGLSDADISILDRCARSLDTDRRQLSESLRAIIARISGKGAM